MRPPSSRETLACFAVLFVNAVVMSVELLATRLLFPRYGNTIFAWSAVITIVIVGLFAGYIAGGWLADRAKSPFSAVSGELWAAAALTFAVPYLGDRLLLAPAAGSGSMPPLLPCFLVFGLPMACLAAVPPAAVGLLAAEGRHVAGASGLVSALSAAGSVAGTLATTFWLIPQFGVRALFLGYGAALALLALACALMSGRFKPGKAAAAAAVCLAAAGLGHRANAHPEKTTVVEPVFSRDSHYQLVRVFERGTGEELTRVMMLDSTQEGAMRLASRDVVFDYTRAYKAFENAFAKHPAPRLLFIGGGAYTMPVAAARALPRASVDVAELDPVVTKAAVDYFRAGESPNVSTIAADGRQAAARAPGAYDGVFVDAYQGVYAIPFHLATREFFQTLSAALKPEGFAAFNVIGSITEQEGFLCSFAHTLRSVYPRVDLYPVHGLDGEPQNVILLGYKGKAPEGHLRGAHFPDRLTYEGLPCRRPLLLTDDRAPVEWLVAQYLRR